MRTADGASLRTTYVQQGRRYAYVIVLDINGVDFSSTLSLGRRIAMLRRRATLLSSGERYALNLRLTYDPHITLSRIWSISQATLIVTVIHHAW